MQRLQDEYICKDLVQETFLAAWRNFSRYKRETSVKNWLFLILKTRIFDHFRRSRTRTAIESIRSEHDDYTFFDKEEHWRKGMYPKNWTVDFTNSAEAKEFQQVFRSCNKKLKQVQSTVFVMKYVEEMDSHEICTQLGLTPANYWVLLHRAKVQLRACLEKNWIQK